MSGYGTRPTRGLLDVQGSRDRMATALLGVPERVGNAFTGMAQQGLLANEQFLLGRDAQGGDLTQGPFLPSMGSGGRIGELASFLMSNMAMGGPAGSLGAGPSMGKKTLSSASDLAKALAESGLQSKITNSQSMSERHGPSLSSYLDVFDGEKPLLQARVSDHAPVTGSHQGGPDFRLGADFDRAMQELMHALGRGPAPAPLPPPPVRLMQSIDDVRSSSYRDKVAWEVSQELKAQGVKSPRDFARQRPEEYAAAYENVAARYLGKPF